MKGDTGIYIFSPIKQQKYINITILLEEKSYSTLSNFLAYLCDIL